MKNVWSVVSEQQVFLVLIALREDRPGLWGACGGLGPAWRTPRSVAPGVQPRATGLALPCLSPLETGLDSGPLSPDPRRPVPKKMFPA